MYKTLLLSFTFVFFSCNIHGEHFRKMNTKDVDNLQREMVRLLKKDVEENSGRQNVLILLNVAQYRERIEFSLTRRCQRDTLFFLKITDGKDGLKVNGRLRRLEQTREFRELIGKYFDEKIRWQVDAGPLGFGLICVPCANLYVEPREEAGGNLASQLLCNTPIVLLETTADKKFFRVEGELDGYIGWIKAEVFDMITPARRRGLGTYGYIDKSEGLLAAGTLVFKDERTREKVSAEKIISTAKRFLPEGDLGPVDYLWGGTCVPHLDCSGFVQTVYRINGLLLPRDADQQYQFSRRVSVEKMQSGDLIFFSKHKRHPTHVGICLGGSRFIHCSPSGPVDGVKINDLDGDTDYDKFLKSIYYGAGRLLPE